MSSFNKTATAQANALFWNFNMSLDPESVTLLRIFDKIGVSQAYKQPLPQYRASTKPPGLDLSIEREALAGVEDRCIPGPGGPIPIRIYRAREAAGTIVPLLLFFHGGGFVVGDLDSHDGLCCQLSREAGCVAVAVDYRLAPEHVFPAAVDDAEAALHWVAANAAELGIDPRRIVVCGESAGANLATVVALRVKTRGGPAIALQLLAYPATDMSGDAAPRLENREGYFITAELMEWFSDQYLPDHSQRWHPDASPLLAKDLSGLPPAHVLTAEYDPLRAEGEAYARSLQAAGVPVRLHRFEGTIHGFLAMYPMIGKGRQAITEFATSIRQLSYR